MYFQYMIFFKKKCITLFFPFCKTTCGFTKQSGSKMDSGLLSLTWLRKQLLPSSWVHSNKKSSWLKKIKEGGKRPEHWSSNFYNTLFINFISLSIYFIFFSSHVNDQLILQRWWSISQKLKMARLDYFKFWVEKLHFFSKSELSSLVLCFTSPWNLSVLSESHFMKSWIYSVDHWSFLTFS